MLNILKRQLRNQNENAEQLRKDLKAHQDKLDLIEAMPTDITKEAVALYMPAVDDPVDAMMAEYVNSHAELPFKIQRHAANQYRFGTKLLQAKITLGKLKVRVGGVFMTIDEYIAYSANDHKQKNLELSLESEIPIGLHKGLTLHPKTARPMG